MHAAPIRLLAAVLLVAGAGFAHAQEVPARLTFAARLADAGRPVAGRRPLSFAFFDAATGGTRLWGEAHEAVDVQDGRLSIEIGAHEPLDTTIFTGEPLYLEVTVGDTVLAPRLPINSVPYAIRAGVAARAEKLGDLAPEALVRGVTAGAGLEGGGTQGDVTLGVRFGGSGAAQAAARADHEHDASYLPRGATLECAAGAKAVGFDAVTGNVRCAPDEDALRGLACGTGDVVTWTGDAWACAPAARYTGAAPVVVAGSTVGLTTGCAPGEVLKWSGTAWTCAPDEASAMPRSCPAGQIVVSTGPSRWACTVNCAYGTADCDGVAANGCESFLGLDPENCASCGHACQANHLTPTCAAGVCGGACHTGWADCNGDKTTDGCEIPLTSDPDNCGACGVVCSSANVAVRSCGGGGVCNGTCSTGFDDCNADRRGDGCETATSADANNCGGCGRICSSNNMASRTCAAGLCSGTCTPGFGDCNGNRLSDGCESNTNTDRNNCGGCGKPCPSPANGIASCTGGACGIGACNANFGNCDSNASNGCETMLSTDPNHCGGCAQACSSNHVSYRSCSNGACGGVCNSGFLDCNGNMRSDGCETNSMNDASHCGGCGKACPYGRSCVSGSCQ